MTSAGDHNPADTAPGTTSRQTVYGRYCLTVIFGAFLLIILLELLTRRFFCRTFCPLGGLLAFLGTKRNLRVHLQSGNCTNCGNCDNTCPMGLKPSLGEGISSYCWNCGECLDSCSHNALAFDWNVSGN